MSPLDYLQFVVVGFGQLLPIAVGLILCIGLAGLGALSGGGQSAPEANPIYVWALPPPISPWLAFCNARHS